MSADTLLGGSRRDRRERGMRGPAFGRTTLAPRGVPAARSPAKRFDALALAVVDDVLSRCPVDLHGLELAVEEIPLLPATWASDTVPLASYVEGSAGVAPRLVLFRRPIEHRAESRADLEALVLTVVVEQVAEVLGISPEDLHPDYEA